MLAVSMPFFLLRDKIVLDFAVAAISMTSQVFGNHFDNVKYLPINFNWQNSKNSQLNNGPLIIFAVCVCLCIMKIVFLNQLVTIVHHTDTNFSAV